MMNLSVGDWVRFKFDPKRNGITWILLGLKTVHRNGETWYVWDVFHERMDLVFITLLDRVEMLASFGESV
jgi:hypothetical protein